MVFKPGQLRRAQLAAKISQEELSFRAKVDRGHVSQLEGDLKSPTVGMLLCLCRAQGVSAARIIARIEAG